MDTNLKIVQAPAVQDERLKVNQISLVFDKQFSLQAVVKEKLNQFKEKKKADQMQKRIKVGRGKVEIEEQSESEDEQMVTASEEMVVN